MASGVAGTVETETGQLIVADNSPDQQQQQGGQGQHEGISGE